MDTTALDGFTRGKSSLNFNYLMNLYEVNYTLFTNFIQKIPVFIAGSCNWCVIVDDINVRPLCGFAVMRDNPDRHSLFVACN